MHFYIWSKDDDQAKPLGSILWNLTRFYENGWNKTEEELEEKNYWAEVNLEVYAIESE